MEAHVPEVLVLRALKLGDLLVAVPALKALRRAFPDHRITYAAQSWLAPVVELVGGIGLLETHGLDEPIARRPGDVDVAVNLHGNGAESRARIEALDARRLIAYGAVDRPGPAWDASEHERVRWCRLLQWHGIAADPTDLSLRRPPQPTVHPGTAIVHPGAAYASRHWPVERFAAVVRELGGAGHEVRLTGSAAERERALAVARAAGLDTSHVLAGRLPLGDFAALVADACCVVSADTGAAHLASAYGVPSVVLFGPAPPESWGPPEGPHRVLTRAELRVGDTFATTPDPALLAVTTDDVLEALSGLGLLARA
ncbi:glycosyltransferase family 9 protein [Arthrobacter sp. JSM 101049]|uniref:glycosyltransferase family 9 protein n=1 Tax=Arthrobacter sp. JSM 101049 TaxID=929097 RepID=UPI003563FF6B